ncbi:unnamed protein product [Ixodes pacificus]
MGRKQAPYGKRKIRKSLIENTRLSRPSRTSTDIRKHTLADVAHPDLLAAQGHAPAPDCGSGVGLFGANVPTATSPGDKWTFPPKLAKSIQFKCGFCYYITKDQHGMVSHLIHHAEGRWLECRHCPLLPSGLELYHHNDPDFKPFKSANRMNTFNIERNMQKNTP